MTVFVLIVWLTTGPQPLLAFSTPEECWQAAKELRQSHGALTDCRAANTVMPVKILAPLTSPRPMQKPERDM